MANPVRGTVATGQSTASRLRRSSEETRYYTTSFVILFFPTFPDSSSLLRTPSVVMLLAQTHMQGQKDAPL